MNDEQIGVRGGARLPDEPEVRTALDQSARGTVVDVVAAHPSSPLAWAERADEADSEGHVIDSYAYATVAVEFACRAMRQSGWEPGEPVPWSEEPNRPYLRALDAKRRAAKRLGLTDEADRLTEELSSADAGAAARIASEYTPTQAMSVIPSEFADITVNGRDSVSAMALGGELGEPVLGPDHDTH